jgi:class 3 adenylate cyclase
VARYGLNVAGIVRQRTGQRHFFRGQTAILQVSNNLQLAPAALALRCMRHAELSINCRALRISSAMEGTLAQLKGHRRALVDPKIATHRGRIVKTTGDGMLVEFTSVVEALKCAVEVQWGMIERNAEVPPEKRIEFRVGIHQRDIIIDGDDMFGDGVNVAARLEGLAEPGGICVSGRVQEDARGKLDVPSRIRGSNSSRT